jgi:hypothetical protein
MFVPLRRRSIEDFPIAGARDGFQIPRHRLPRGHIETERQRQTEGRRAVGLSSRPRTFAKERREDSVAREPKDEADHVRVGSAETSDNTGITRREAIKYLGRGAVVAGVVASGVVRAPAAVAQSSGEDGEDQVTKENLLRSVAWASGGFYGLVELGPDVASVQRLLLDGSTLRVDETVVAEIGVAAGPVALAVDADRNQFLVARSIRHVLRELTYSFDLEADLAKWFADEGFPAQETPTSGTGTYRVSVARPSIAVVGAQRGQGVLPITGSLPEVSLEPVALSARPGGYELVATSSGRYGTETNLADEVVVITLSNDGSIVELRPVATQLGHDVTEVRAVETGRGGFTVSVRTSEKTRFFTDSDGRFAEISPSSSLSRFGSHDRIPVSGFADSWLAEVGPGVFAIESGLD